ncbi:hypothetical protein Tco_0436233 [Tanacetum coccineum]
MSTQQDIYAAGSKNRAPMLNKDNYIPWSSRLLRYAKSKPNRKFLVNSIKNGPYVRRMIHEPGVPNSVPHVDESTQEQTDDELIKKELKKIEADDQAIQTILMGLPEDIYAANVGNQNGLIVVLGIANLNVNPNGYENVVAARDEGNVRPRRRDAAYLQTQLLIAQKEEVGIKLQAEEFDLIDAAGDIDEIKKVNANCILIVNLQQASTLGTQTDKAPVYDSDGTAEAAKFDREFKSLAEEADESLNKITVLKKNERLLRAVVSQDIMSIVQRPTIVETSDLQTKLEHTKERFENSYNDMQNQIERLQAQLGDLKGQSMNTHYASKTLDHLSQILDDLDDENVCLELQFVKPSILEKPPASLESKLYSVTPFPNPLSNPVTSHSVPKTQESKVVQNDKVIASGIFRTNPLKNYRVDNCMPNKQVKARVRTKPINVSQPHVITKKDVNSKTNGLPSIGVESTGKTRRLQPRSSLKNDRIPSASTCSCLSNNLEKVEKHNRKLLFSKTPNHRSSESNNIKLGIRNDKSEVIFVTCKQCLITANHDECVFKYVNGMNSSKKNQSANASESVNQTKHKAHVNKLKKLGFKERLASPRPHKPRTCLRRLPTRRIFDLCGKITTSSNTESDSDTSVCDNASASNHQEPTSKGFPNSTSFLDRLLRTSLLYEVDFISMGSLKRASGHGKTEHELKTQSAR